MPFGVSTVRGRYGVVWSARGVVLAARILSQFGLTGRVECACACFREVEVVTVVKWIIRFFFCC